MLKSLGYMRIYAEDAMTNPVEWLLKLCKAAREAQRNDPECKDPLTPANNVRLKATMGYEAAIQKYFSLESNLPAGLHSTRKALLQNLEYLSDHDHERALRDALIKAEPILERYKQTNLVQKPEDLKRFVEGKPVDGVIAIAATLQKDVPKELRFFRPQLHYPKDLSEAQRASIIIGQGALCMTLGSLYYDSRVKELGRTAPIVAQTETLSSGGVHITDGSPLPPGSGERENSNSPKPGLQP